MGIRTAIIGAGVHGSRYARHIVEDVDGLNLVAVCRRDLEACQKVADKWNAKAFSDAQELIHSGNIDAVVIATPPSSHFSLACAALKAGLAVLLEKPMTGNIDEAQKLAAIAALPDSPPLMLAQTLRWNPVLKRVREILPSLGTIRYWRISQRLEPTVLPWQQDSKQSVGGSILLTGVHLIDTLRFLTGEEFTEVDCRLERYRNPAVEDFFHAHARLSGGSHVSMEVSKFGRFRGCLIEAVGDEGQIWAEYYKGGIRVNRGGKTTTEDISAAIPTLPEVLSAWRDSIRNKATPPVTVTDGVHIMKVIAVCYESAQAGRPITVA